MEVEARVQPSPKKVVVTITGIRPDFIRMSRVFAELDKHFKHILIHTGQHYDTALSDVFFQQLGIRAPDYQLQAGKESTNHFEQLAYLTREIPRLFARERIDPDLIVFLGDSNSAGVAFPLKKEGYRIAHIEAGMRSYDKRMLEEINRTVCDHCSDFLFVYHEDYKLQLAIENIQSPHQHVVVVGNTIVEPLQMFRAQITSEPKRNDMILVDIHRPENFHDKHRMANLLRFANECIVRYNVPVKILYFKRLVDAVVNFALDLGQIEMIPLMTYKDYLTTVYHSKFLISDSGTGQEEPALLDTPVIVPRDFTERPQSYAAGCSFPLKVEKGEDNRDEVHAWLHTRRPMDCSWLGDGTTSQKIVAYLLEHL